MVRMRLRVWVVAGAGVVALALVASACSNNPAPSASGNGSTTTSGRSSTSTSAGAGGSSTTSTTAGASHGGPAVLIPTLGVSSAWGASAVGFGLVRPGEISLGGDPTGVLTGITWQSWGGDTATGTGTSTYVAPNQSTAQGMQETATVVASDLGSCGGGPAYQQVKWYFPGQGETLSSGPNSTINACSGP